VSGDLVISEMFGPTVQGEGPSAGRNAAFIRLSGCSLASSGMPAVRRIRGRALAALSESGHARFKFVAAAIGDLREIAELQQQYGLDPVWVMPEGTTGEAVLDGMRLLADEVIARGWNLTPRLHVLLWGDTRGR
jgi:7-carboxy-7-deazaguanine synthase